MRKLKPASIWWLVRRQKWYTVTSTAGVSGLLPITVPRAAPLPLSSCIVFHSLSQNTSWIERWCVVGGSHLWSSFAWSFDQDNSSVTMGWEGWAELQFSFSFFLLACVRCSYLHKKTTYWAFSKYTLCWKKKTAFMQLGWRQGDYLHDVMIFLSGKFQRKKRLVWLLNIYREICR